VAITLAVSIRTYIEPLGAGLVYFLIAAVLLAVPYLLIIWRIEGGLPPRRLLVAVLFLLFVVMAWAQVLLPLPDDNVCLLREVSAQLQPFRWISDTVAWGERQSVSGLELLLSPPVVVRVLNVLLLVPLGVFLRRWWGVRFWPSVAIGFAVSLSFELTQWTGVWGWYDCAYRMFDVDDLIANTAGAALGWAIAGVFTFIPDRSRDSVAS
jgi:glycopeptide antibiotics resistance protein